MCTRITRLWFKLLSVRGVSAERWLSLTRVMSVEEISNSLQTSRGRRELSNLIQRRVGRPDRVLIERQQAFVSKDLCGAISLSDAEYPKLLREIEIPPPVLFYRGDISVIDRPAVCIVGSRGAGRRSLLIARKFALGLASRGILVVSGMARGVDSMSHRGALDLKGGLTPGKNERWRSWTLMNVEDLEKGIDRGGGKGGVTCAVLGCGVDVPYPAENTGLAVEIARNGCIISEFLPGSKPLKHHFPRRNRILSGISVGVVVVEAGEKSGAMNTAAWAVEQNREVFAVPGPIEYEGCRGPHKLIRNGACLVESVEDIMREFPPCGRIGGDRQWSEDEEIPIDIDDRERTIIESMDLDPKHIDEIANICNISPITIQSVMLELQLKGLVERCRGGRYALVPSFIGSSRRNMLFNRKLETENRGAEGE